MAKKTVCLTCRTRVVQLVTGEWLHEADSSRLCDPPERVLTCPAFCGETLLVDSGQGWTVSEVEQAVRRHKCARGTRGTGKAHVPHPLEQGRSPFDQAAVTAPRTPG